MPWPHTCYLTLTRVLVRLTLFSPESLIAETLTLRREVTVLAGDSARLPACSHFC